MVLLCECMQVARSGYYAWKGQSIQNEEPSRTSLEDKISEIFTLSDKTYGFRRIKEELRNEGIVCNHKKVRRMMKKLELMPKVKRRFKATTNSDHKLPVAANLIERNFDVEGPNKVWVGDITYIQTQQGWLYLAVVIDLYSRKVKGWCMSERMTVDIAMNALKMAINDCEEIQGTIFHSDRGIQYAAYPFKKLMKEHGIIQSMSRKGDCWDNAVAESFFGTLKQEHVYHCKFETREEAKLSIFKYIEVFYNRKRLHSKLNYQSPEKFERLALAA